MDFFFFFNDTATTEIYTLSLHDALPIFGQPENGRRLVYLDNAATTQKPQAVLDAVAEYYRTTNANVHRGAYDLAIRATEDRKSTRLNSSHSQISYAVFCLKKKKYMPQPLLVGIIKVQEYGLTISYHLGIRTLAHEIQIEISDRHGVWRPRPARDENATTAT